MSRLAKWFAWISCESISLSVFTKPYFTSVGKLILYSIPRDGTD